MVKVTETSYECKICKCKSEQKSHHKSHLKFSSETNAITSYYEDSPDHDLIERFVDQDGNCIKRINYTIGITYYYEGPGPTPYRKNDLPAVITRHGSREWRDQEGLLHRDKGPSVIYNCEKQQLMMYSHDRDAHEFFTQFVNCTEKYYDHGKRIDQPGSG